MNLRTNILFAILMLLSMQVISQENLASLSGGYSFANIEDTDVKGTGWRLNGLYEFNPLGGIFAHGISFGYVHLEASEDVGLQTTTRTISSFPIYYAPKLMFGTDKIKAFVKGAVGMQFASLKREGLVDLNDFDFGFYCGGGGGIMIFLKENIFFNAEYEIAWASNSWYKDGWMNSAMGGIGFRF